MGVLGVDRDLETLKLNNEWLVIGSELNDNKVLAVFKDREDARFFIAAMKEWPRTCDNCRSLPRCERKEGQTSCSCWRVHTPPKIPKTECKKAYAFCESCDYETESMLYGDLILKLSEEGGYISSDRAGGYYSQCPKCGSSGLTLEVV